LAQVLQGTVLLALMLGPVRLLRGQITDTTVKSPAAALTNSPAKTWWRTRPRNIAPGGVSGEVSTAGGTVTRPVFNWQQIESTDYREYVQNLRAIHCPEQTLRDIVSADVIQAYASKRSEALAARYQHFKFWQADPEAMAELARQRRAVDEATASTLIALLGPDFVVPSFTPEWKSAELEQQLGFLAPDKRRPTQGVWVRYAETDAHHKQLADGHRGNEDTEELQRIVADYERKHAELSQLLTPEEHELVELTCSWTAHNLRRALTHFNPTETEFRAIFRAWREQDENLARTFAAGRPDPGTEQVHERIKGLLSEDRYREYRATWWK